MKPTLNPELKPAISALMDGELAGPDCAGPLRELRADTEALETWRTYHLIGDAMRDTCKLSPGFSARFAERLSSEPTVLSPASIPVRPATHRYRLPLSIAASLAAVSVVGWLAFSGTGPQVEQVAQVKTKDPAVSTVSTVVPMRGEVNDYLMAHQNYSPRSTLQGVAPYVRTVSDNSKAR
jgi:sigma-E factor negative regulatory protein RseA